jgi:hypothetical protein
VELLSVIASERRLKKPLEVPRPEWLRHGGDGGGVSRAVAVLQAQALAGGGRVRVHRPQGAT